MPKSITCLANKILNHYSSRGVRPLHIESLSIRAVRQYVSERRTKFKHDVDDTCRPNFKYTLMYKLSPMLAVLHRRDSIGLNARVNMGMNIRMSIVT